jgi:hypothetical protein
MENVRNRKTIVGVLAAFTVIWGVGFILSLKSGNQFCAGMAIALACATAVRIWEVVRY